MAIPKACGVYVITHTPTGKHYVGSSADIYERVHVHMSHLKSGVHSNSRFQEIWTNATDYEIDYELFSFRDEAYDRETELLDLLVNQPLCVNVHNHSRHGFAPGTMPKNAIANLSKAAAEANRNRAYATGHHHTEESIEKMREARSFRSAESYNPGRPLSEETKAKIGEFQRSRPRAKGFNLSEEHKANLTASVKLAGIARSKKVSLDGIVYNNAAYAAEAKGVTRRTIVLRIQSDDEKYKDWKYID